MFVYLKSMQLASINLLQRTCVYVDNNIIEFRFRWKYSFLFNVDYVIICILIIWIKYKKEF